MRTICLKIREDIAVLEWYLAKMVTHTMKWNIFCTIKMHNHTHIFRALSTQAIGAAYAISCSEWLRAIEPPRREKKSWCQTATTCPPPKTF